ncbi:MAG: class II fructose-bisphosphate aldolase, partial [Actinomycetes bacterium]
GSVMVDASKLPYEANVELTRDAVAWAHARALWVEAELGEVGGKDGAHAPGARTDPGEADEFVAATGVDALAVAVGSSHAMTRQTAVLDVELIRQLHDAVPVPLVLHGSSGVPDASLREAVTAGIAKVNIGTALNVAFTAAVRQRLDAETDLVDPRRYLRPARDAMAAVVTASLRALSPAA